MHFMRILSSSRRGTVGVAVAVAVCAALAPSGVAYAAYGIADGYTTVQPINAEIEPGGTEEIGWSMAVSEGNPFSATKIEFTAPESTTFTENRYYVNGTARDNGPVANCSRSADLRTLMCTSTTGGLAPSQENWLDGTTYRITAQVRVNDDASVGSTLQGSSLQMYTNNNQMQFWSTPPAGGSVDVVDPADVPLLDPPVGAAAVGGLAVVCAGVFLVRRRRACPDT
ncbi:hypothetical protein ACWEQ8_20855 [Streptomyces noursei]